MDRIVKGQSATLRLPTSVKVTSGTLTLTRDRDGVKVLDAAAVTVEASEVICLLGAQTDEANLVGVWTLTTEVGAQTFTNRVEVVSCESVSVDEMRLRRPLDDPNRYPDRRLISARTQLENELSDRAGVKVNGGEFTVTIDGRGTSELFLPVGKPRTITKVTVDGVAISSEDLATVKIDVRQGIIIYAKKFASGRMNVTVQGVSGFDQPIGGLSSAMGKGVRYMVVDSPTQDRAISVSTSEGTTENMMVAGLRGAIFAIPELNMIVESARSTFGLA